MEAISLTKAQWDYIMTPILQTALPRSGIVRTFPRDILYAPKELFGFRLMHPYYKQYLKQLALILKETQKEDITADLLVSVLEQLRLESALLCTNGDWQIQDSSCYLIPNHGYDTY